MKITNLPNKFIGLLALMVFFISCGEKPSFVQYNDMTNESWAATDTLTFQLNGDVKSKPLQLNIRNSADYQFQNIWVDVAVGTNKFERKEIMLASNAGHWLGKKSGKFYTTITPLNITIPNDSAKVKVLHLMRTKQLQGVQAIGVSVE